MTGLFSDWPYPLAVTRLFLIALARGNVTYWVGRAAEAGARRTRARRLIESPGFARAGRLLNRWGPPVVSVSFLTVGFQTLINLAYRYLIWPRQTGAIIGDVVQPPSQRRELELGHDSANTDAEG